VLPGRSGQPLQCLLEVDDRPGALAAGQLKVVDHGIDDLQPAAALGGRGHRIAGKYEPISGARAGRHRHRRVIPASGIDDLDRALPVPGPGLYLVLVAGPGVPDDVSAGLAERQGNVGAGVRRDAESLQAAIENLAGYGHAGGIAGQVQHQVDFHAILLRPDTGHIGRPSSLPQPGHPKPSGTTSGSGR
jgi:hypothetical protein